MDVSTDAVVGLLDVLANKGEGVGRGQHRKQLVLLRLVVQDLGLWLSGDRVTFQPPSTCRLGYRAAAAQSLKRLVQANRTIRWRRLHGYPLTLA